MCKMQNCEHLPVPGLKRTNMGPPFFNEIVTKSFFVIMFLYSVHKGHNHKKSLNLFNSLRDSFVYSMFYSNTDVREHDTDQELQMQ